MMRNMNADFSNSRSWPMPGEVSFCRWRNRIKASNPLSMRQILSSECRKAVVDGFRVLENVYVWQDSVIFELDKIAVDELRECSHRMWYLRKVYVVDSNRGCGFGERFVSELKRWCDVSGSVVGLCAVGFCLRSSEFSAGCSCFDTVNEVLRCWKNELIVPSGLDVLLENFYARMGFDNARLPGARSFASSNEMCLKKQFIYVGCRVPDAERIAIIGQKDDECACELCRA